jgi:hypothetical protein
MHQPNWQIYDGGMGPFIGRIAMAAICAVGGKTKSWTSVSEWRQLKLWLSVL